VSTASRPLIGEADSKGFFSQNNSLLAKWSQDYLPTSLEAIDRPVSVRLFFFNTYGYYTVSSG